MRASSLAAVLFPLLAAATPVPAADPEPVSAEGLAELNVNVILNAGAAQFGVLVPVNGLWYPTSSLTCINVGAGSYGACSTPSFDRVGVIAGNGPCSFIGSNGFWLTLQGTAGEGLAWIAPPQRITWISCG